MSDCCGPKLSGGRRGGAGGTAFAGDVQLETTAPDDEFEILTTWNNWAVQVDTTLGNGIVILPDSTTVPQGFQVTVFKDSADINPVEFQVQGTDTLNTAPSLTKDADAVTFALVDKAAGTWKAVWNYYVAAPGVENGAWAINPLLSQNSDFTATGTQPGSVYPVDTSGGAVVATLPAHASLQTGYKVSFYLEAGAVGTLTVNANVGGSVDGQNVFITPFSGGTFDYQGGGVWLFVANILALPVAVLDGGTGAQQFGPAQSNLKIFPNGTFDAVAVSQANPNDAANAGKLWLMDSTGGNLTFTLAAIGGSVSGFYTFVKNVGTGGNTVTILPNGAETIDGGASVALADNEFCLLRASSATNWELLIRGSDASGIIGTVGVIDNAVPRADGVAGNKVQGSKLGIGDVAGPVIYDVNGGNARGAEAVDLQFSRNAATQVASGAQAVIGGGLRNTSSSTQGVVGGGISNNCAGDLGVIPGGQENEITSGAPYGVAEGLRAQASHYGEKCFGHDQFSAVGDSQSGELHYRGQTTDATPTEFSLLGSGGYLTLLDGDAYMVEVLATAKATGAVIAGWGSAELRGLIYRAGATTAWQGTGNATPGADVGAPTLALQLSADDTNDRLAVTGTGTGGATFDWTIIVRYTKVKLA